MDEPTTGFKVIGAHARGGEIVWYGRPADPEAPTTHTQSVESFVEGGPVIADVPHWIVNDVWRLVGRKAAGPKAPIAPPFARWGAQDDADDGADPG